MRGRCTSEAKGVSRADLHPRDGMSMLGTLDQEVAGSADGLAVKRNVDRYTPCRPRAARPRTRIAQCSTCAVAGERHQWERASWIHRTLTLYPPSPSSSPHWLTIARRSPCNQVFTRPRRTGPLAEPFPFPVMIWTTAPAFRRRQLSRNARTADRASVAPSPCRSSSASARASSSGSRESNVGWRPLLRLLMLLSAPHPVPAHLGQPRSRHQHDSVRARARRVVPARLPHVALAAERAHRTDLELAVVVPRHRVPALPDESFDP